jgi:transcriptional regulator MraZ
MLFLGKHDYSMDERGRVPMPPRYREAFLQGLILTQGSPDPCIRAYPVTGFEQQAALYMSEPATTRNGRIRRRAFFSNAYPAELDRQGRVLVPQPLRDWAGLNNHIVVAGAGEWLEIWSTEAFDAAVLDEALEFRQDMGSE